MNGELKKIVIVGGGSAGWLTAGILAAEYDLSDKANFDIVLIESPDIPTIGVGEGTWPSMRNTLKKIGVSETDFFRECDASFKQGSKFIGWKSGGDDHYYHPFTLPEQYSDINAAEFWLPLKDKISFADIVSPQSAVAQRHLAPKLMSTAEYAGIMNYGYHLDAIKCAQFLKKHCIEKLGVTYISDHVVAIHSKADGDIESLALQSAGILEGDLFIDCSGFSSMLLGAHFGIPLKEERRVLFNDSALAVQVAYPDPDHPIESCTLSTAQTAGWIWDIGLPTRRGVGHVYSSAHSTDQEVEAALLRYLEPSIGKKAVEKLSLRKLTFNPGYREKLWHKNCVAVGIAAGFIEPLEATALVLIELSAQMIAEQLPANREVMDIAAQRFNDKFAYRWQKIIEFLKLHYVLTQRTDSDYWRDHCDSSTMPDFLSEQLRSWRYQTPWTYDNVQADEMFPSASYQYVMFGMGYAPMPKPFSRRQLDRDRNAAFRVFDENEKKTALLLSRLIPNRELLKKLRDFEFQKI